MSRPIKLRKFFMALAMSGGCPVRMCGHRHLTAKAAGRCEAGLLERALDAGHWRSLYTVVHEIIPVLGGTS